MARINAPPPGRGRPVTDAAKLVRLDTTERLLRDGASRGEILDELGATFGYTDDCDALTNKIVRMWFERAQRAAGLEVTGAIHRLRHTFCSMLASEGAPPGAIQKLAGHASISTTMKYMHLSPTMLDAAISLLDVAFTRPNFGETVEKVGR